MHCREHLGGGNRRRERVKMHEAAVIKAADRGMKAQQ